MEVSKNDKNIIAAVYEKVGVKVTGGYVVMLDSGLTLMYKYSVPMQFTNGRVPGA
jgi:hypothetical protein